MLDIGLKPKYFTKSNQFHSNLVSSQPTSHAKNIPIVVCAVPPDDEQIGA
jgi:hypothetical protein